MSLRHNSRNTRPNNPSPRFANSSRRPYLEALHDTLSEDSLEGNWSSGHGRPIQRGHSFTTRSENSESSRGLPPPYQGYAMDNRARANGNWGATRQHQVLEDENYRATLQSQLLEDEAMNLLTEVTTEETRPPSDLYQSPVIRQLLTAEGYNVFGDDLTLPCMRGVLRRWERQLEARLNARIAQGIDLTAASRDRYFTEKHGTPLRNPDEDTDDESVQTFYTAHSRN